jgi:4'-phosphopantetheinyl transferase
MDKSGSIGGMRDLVIHLWWASLRDFSSRIDDLEARLPADEQQRARRFRVSVAGHRFVLARTLLRRVVGGTLNVDPTSLVFATGERGKPHLAAPETDHPPHFNLSHSDKVVVLAVAPMEIGVDVENFRHEANAERLARRFFGPAERKVVCDLDAAARDRAFLRIWTQKEAYLKATGIGVGMPLREVETEPDPQAPPRLLVITGDRDEAARWTLLEVEVPGAVSMVAVREPAPKLHVQQFMLAELETR